MSKPGLAFGLNFAKKPGAAKPAPPKKRSMFGDDNDSDDDNQQANKAEDIGGDLDDFGTTRIASASDSKKDPKSKQRVPAEPPKMKLKAQPNAMFGDLSSALSSRKNAEAATDLDASVYEYDSVYDSLKPKKKDVAAEKDRRPKYMQSLMQAAEVRKRDALIAEEKKIAREREAEGDEYQDKEKFVTEAYKKQQAENRRLEEEEKRREEEEAKKNKGGGMSAFYKKLLDKDEERHAEAMKAAQEIAKSRPEGQSQDEEAETNAKSEADLAQELNDKGASIAVNEDGQVVDKRQLLKGGLNVGAKKKEPTQKEDFRPAERDRRDFNGPQMGRKQAMRERQSRMMAEQLEQSMKRSREDEEAQRQEVERSAKSRKTEGEISSAKERYLARKRAAEEAKKNSAEQA
ncbi:Nuclear speckle splicing regulatory protein [Paramyrothecium foliicola]|nr:Nuclear speckle splicing regulatory protein [Paramyrothecium foliicola]